MDCTIKAFGLLVIRGGPCANANQVDNRSTGNSSLTWPTMSPSRTNSLNGVFSVLSSSVQFTSSGSTYYNSLVRPVISLKSCVTIIGGNGSVSSPYTVGLTSACAAYDE